MVGLMDLLETLSLALALEVNLELVGNRLKATPLENVTEDLNDGVTANLEDLKEHLRQTQESWQYALLTDIAVAGITLRLKPDGRLMASPKEAVDSLQGRIKEHRDFLADCLRDDEEIRSQVEVTLLARSRFDTELHERVPTVQEAWADPDKKEFFMGSKLTAGKR